MTVKKTVIVKLGDRENYLTARRIAAKNGMKLASNVLHDIHLSTPFRMDRYWGNSANFYHLTGDEIAKVRRDYAELVKEYPRIDYPAWARELLAYPETNCRFSRWRDIVGHFDTETTPWVLPRSEIVKAGLAKAIRNPNVGLFIDPGMRAEDMHIERYKGKDAVIVHPQSIVLLEQFIQSSVAIGDMEYHTGIPLWKPSDIKRSAMLDDRRVLHRIHGLYFGPIKRDKGYSRYYGCEIAYQDAHVYANIHCNSYLAIAGEKVVQQTGVI